MPSGGIGLVGVGVDAQLWHTQRYDGDGSWQPFMGALAGVERGGPGGFKAVACGGVADDLGVVGVGSDGKLWHTIRHKDGRWQSNLYAAEGVNAGGPPNFTAVGCAGVGTDLAVVGVGSDGKLWHTIRHSNGSWQGSFGEIEGVNAGGPPNFATVGCGADDAAPGVLQVVGVGSDGQLWHTLRQPSGAWQGSFGLIKNMSSGGPSSFLEIGCAGATMTSGVDDGDIGVDIGVSVDVGGDDPDPDPGGGGDGDDDDVAPVLMDA